MKVEVGDKTIEIRPLKVGQVPAFLQAIGPVLKDIEAGLTMEALTEHGDEIIRATAIGAEVDEAWLREQSLDVLIELATAVIEVNADFFVRNVAPRMKDAAERINQLTA